MDSILRGLLAGTNKRQVGSLFHPPSTAPKAAAGAKGDGAGKRSVASAPKLARAPHKDLPSDDDSSDDERVELIAGKGGVSSKVTGPVSRMPLTDGKSKAGLIQSTSSSLEADLSVDAEAVRSFRKRLGIKITGNGIVDPYEQFTSIPEALSGEALAHVSSTCCARFVPASAAPTSQTVDAKPSKKAAKVVQHSHVPVAQTAAQAASRHTAVRRSVLANIEASAYAEPLPVQMQALPAMLVGRDVLAVAPTGSGKTAAFALPLILSLQGHAGCGPRALIITPTKELAGQTQREVDRLAQGTGLRCAVLTRASASSASGQRISATSDASDLVKAHGRKRRRDAEAARGSSGAGKKKKSRRQSVDENDASDDDDGGSDSDGDADEEAGNQSDSAGGSDSDGESHADAAAGGGKGSSLPPLSFPRTVVAPSLPRADILIATPLTLVSLLRHTQAQARVSGSAGEPPKAILPSLRCVVLDEADRLLELGFLEQVDALFDARPDGASLAAYVAEEARELHERRAQGSVPGGTLDARERELRMLASAAGVHLPVASASSSSSAAPASVAALPVRVSVSMLSATMPSGVEELALTVLTDPLRISVGDKGGGASSKVSQKLLFVGREDGKMLALRQLATSGGLTPPVLVFVQSKERAVQLAGALGVEGIKADAVHADKTPEQRAETITRFRRGEVWVLVTTDLLGRGMDFPAVRLVVNYDFPPNPVAYIHRIGRTGRGGREGSAVTLFTEADIPALRSIANVMRLSGCEVPPWMLELRKMSRNDRKRLEKRPAHRAPIFTGSTKYDAKVARMEREERRAAGGKKPKRKQVGANDE